MLYLLDTNILSALQKGFDSALLTRLEQIENTVNHQVAVSVIAALETTFGVKKKGSQKLAEKMAMILATLEILPLDERVLQSYATVRIELERHGQMIGAMDMLMAAHALALDATLVTDNLREFRRVKGLRVENWLRLKAV